MHTAAHRLGRGSLLPRMNAKSSALASGFRLSQVGALSGVRGPDTVSALRAQRAHPPEPGAASLFQLRRFCPSRARAGCEIDSGARTASEKSYTPMRERRGHDTSINADTVMKVLTGRRLRSQVGRAHHIVVRPDVRGRAWQKRQSASAMEKAATPTYGSTTEPTAITCRTHETKERATPRPHTPSPCRCGVRSAAYGCVSWARVWGWGSEDSAGLDFTAVLLASSNPVRPILWLCDMWVVWRLAGRRIHTGPKASSRMGSGIHYLAPCDRSLLVDLLLACLVELQLLYLTLEVGSEMELWSWQKLAPPL